jgi:hypothetical protein
MGRPPIGKVAMTGVEQEAGILFEQVCRLLPKLSNDERRELHPHRRWTPSVSNNKPRQRSTNDC